MRGRGRCDSVYSGLPGVVNISRCISTSRARRLQGYHPSNALLSSARILTALLYPTCILTASLPATLCACRIVASDCHYLMFRQILVYHKWLRAPNMTSCAKLSGDSSPKITTQSRHAAYTIPQARTEMTRAEPRGSRESSAALR